MCLALSSLEINPFVWALHHLPSFFQPLEIIYLSMNSACSEVITFPAAPLVVHLVLESLWRRNTSSLSISSWILANRATRFGEIPTITYRSSHSARAFSEGGQSSVQYGVDKDMCSDFQMSVASSTIIQQHLTLWSCTLIFIPCRNHKHFLLFFEQAVRHKSVLSY